jgi:hypothetical protein
LKEAIEIVTKRLEDFAREHNEMDRERMARSREEDKARAKAGEVPV